jgi:RNA polymerase sigma-70 factor, ECF subfamily
VIGDAATPLDIQMLHARGEEWRATVTYPNESALLDKPVTAAVADSRRHFIARRRNSTNALISRFGDGRARKPGRSRPHAQALEAFEQVLLTSRTKFVALAYSILRNKEDAEDAVQGAFLSAYRHLRSFEGRAALKTWLTRIVLNTALMIRRKQKRSRCVPLADSEPVDEMTFREQIPAAGPDPEKSYGDEAALQEIDAQLAKIPPALRQAFAMTYYDELSNREACQVLDIPISTFKSRVWRARRLVVSRVSRSKKELIASPTAQNDVRLATLRFPTTAPLEPTLS